MPETIMKRLIDPIFNSKVRYALELIADVSNSQDVPLKRLHALHRGAMKAVLGMSRFEHPSDQTLYARTGQKSIFQMAFEATAGLAWKCSRDWKNHPLTKDRLQVHRTNRTTRQTIQREHPPQPTKGSLLSRLIEVWEQAPPGVKDAEHWRAAKREIMDWSSKLHTPS